VYIEHPWRVAERIDAGFVIDLTVKAIEAEMA
jgi:hypothetical protein